MNFIITVAWALLWQINLQALKKGIWPIFLTKEQKGHACPGTEPGCWTETKKQFAELTNIKSVFLHMMYLTLITHQLPSKSSLTHDLSHVRYPSIRFSTLTAEAIFWLYQTGLPSYTTGMVCFKVHSTACPHLKNGKSNCTQGSHVRAHVREMHTFVWPDILQSMLASLCMQTHTHSVQPQGQLSQGEIEREIG